MKHGVLKFTEKFQITELSLEDCGNDNLFIFENFKNEKYPIKSETVGALLVLQKV